MSNIKKILRLIRYQNLLFIVIIQYSMRIFIVKPYLNNLNLEPLFSGFHFFLLVTTTVLLAASGYIINNYFDSELDKKAGKEVFFDKSDSKKTAFNLHLILNLVAVAIGFYISYVINLYKLGFVFIVIAGLLWFYSSSYKKMFLIGNLIVAILSALVPLIVMVYEIPLQYQYNSSVFISLQTNLNDLMIWIAGFSAFAFLLTFIREIIKDIEDIDGDISFNANTLPVILGEKNAKIVVSALIFISIVSIFVITIKFLNNPLSIIYISLLIILPLFFLIVKNFKAKNSKDFHFLSIFTKIIMLFGVLYSVVASINI